MLVVQVLVLSSFCFDNMVSYCNFVLKQVDKNAATPSDLSYPSCFHFFSLEVKKICYVVTAMVLDFLVDL